MFLKINQHIKIFDSTQDQMTVRICYFELCFVLSVSVLLDLSPPYTVPETLPDGHIVLRHHLVDHDALGPQDSREVGQREHADGVTEDASAASIPQLEMVSRQRSVVLLDNPASGDLGDLRYPGQGGDDHLISHGGKLGPLYEVHAMSIEELNRRNVCLPKNF